ncbi:MAG: EVE domain-containing protein [Bacteroidetes bacterium]|nr:EVE domain-containing protein [Bacteroidota bacterium]
MQMSKYWVAVGSKEHTMRGVSGGFMQVCHGKPAPLKRMKADDWIIVYSPKLSMEGEEKCQAFTAIGQTTDENVYQFQMSKDFIPFRRSIKFYDCSDTSILPLIEKLEFIQNKNRWGYPFRFGFFEINEHDFNLISSQMFTYEIARQPVSI